MHTKKVAEREEKWMASPERKERVKARRLEEARRRDPELEENARKLAALVDRVDPTAFYDKEGRLKKRTVKKVKVKSEVTSCEYEEVVSDGYWPQDEKKSTFFYGQWKIKPPPIGRR